jgi:hypothetical protein
MKKFAFILPAKQQLFTVRVAIKAITANKPRSQREMADPAHMRSWG